MCAPVSLLPACTFVNMRVSVWMVDGGQSPRRGQLQVFMNILIFVPGLKLPFVKHPFHHLPLTMGRTEMVERGRKTNIPLKMISKRGRLRGWEEQRWERKASVFCNPSTHKREEVAHLLIKKRERRERKEEPNHYHLHGGAGSTCANVVKGVLARREERGETNVVSKDLFVCYRRRRGEWGNYRRCLGQKNEGTDRLMSD